MTKYAERRQKLDEAMTARGVDLIFLPVSADLEYLTGMRRRVLTFGNIEYAHSWVTGCFFAPGREPHFIMPRMLSEFDLPEGIPGKVTIVNELDDGTALFGRLARSFGPVATVAIGARTWSDTTLHLLEALPDATLMSADRLMNSLRRIKDADEIAAMTRACRIADEALAAVEPMVHPGVTEHEIARDIDHYIRSAGSRAPSFDTGVWSMGEATSRDATVRISQSALVPGLGVSFDFGAVVDGYCSDFGRTVYIGDPSPEYQRVYEVVMEAQSAGIRAVRPGVTAASVDAATRAVIADAGLGEWFRHRTGHCIGLDVHEHPFISEEDDTLLEEGMAFTIEPSVFRPGHYGVRVEDIIVCEKNGGRKINEFPTTMVVHD